MAENATVYLLVEQAIAWALTRDWELVELIGGSSDPGSFDTKIAKCQVALKAKGRDVNVELWKVIGRTAPSGDTITIFDAKMEGRTVVLSNFAEIADDRLRRFPIKDRLAELARAGRLASLGKRLGEAEWVELPPAKWNDLELSPRALEGSISKSVLVATPIRRRGIPESSPGECFRIQFAQAGLLREFPPEPPVVVAAEAEVASASPRLGLTDEQLKEAILGLEASSIDPGANVQAPADEQTTEEEILALLRPVLKQTGKLSQKEAYKIVRGSYPQESRERVRALAKSLTNNTKRGPQSLQKY
jgi:hypothetical protein